MKLAITHHIELRHATNAVIALILLHVLAALYHHFVARHGLTLNMLKFRKRAQPAGREAA